MLETLREDMYVSAHISDVNRTSYHPTQMMNIRHRSSFKLCNRMTIYTILCSTKMDPMCLRVLTAHQTQLEHAKESCMGTLEYQYLLFLQFTFLLSKSCPIQKKHMSPNFICVQYWTCYYKILPLLCMLFIFTCLNFSAVWWTFTLAIRNSKLRNVIVVSKAYCVQLHILKVLNCIFYFDIEALHTFRVVKLQWDSHLMFLV
jgi:hypothetical protein